jgi:hypothetical protein
MLSYMSYMRYPMPHDGKQPHYPPPTPSEWEPEPCYLPLEPPPYAEPKEKEEEEKSPRVIIIPIASPEGAIRMC